MTHQHEHLLNATSDEFGSDPEVPATWVAEHRSEVSLIDVREPHELSGLLGKIDGAENVPLLELLSHASSFRNRGNIVLVCRSGRRSGEAARALRDAGVESVGSVEGGMIAWNAEVLGKTTILEDETAANTTLLREAIYRSNGLPEVSARWVAANIGSFRLIDVREPRELAAEGKVAQAESIPLQTFVERAQTLDRDAPLVVMCASGGRSGRAVRMLEAAGFKSVASLEAGMYGWKASALPIVAQAA
jgi:rhodanese-related sulfurtransferase